MKNLSTAIKIAIPAVFLSSQISSVQAEDAVSLNQSGELELTVTANRREQEVNKTLTANTIITREDIERTQATTVAEVLTRVPGISITNSGGVGKATSVFLRGTESDHVLVLVDGIRHGSATLGSTSFQHLPIGQIDRIEIVRGPRSSLYGSEAIGGVIQIFTRKGYQGFHPSVEISAGSNSTFKGAVGLAGGNGKTSYSINVQHEETDGIDACNSATSGCFADEPDRDGYNSDSLTLNLGHAFSDKVKGDLSILRAEGDTEFDGNFQNEADFVQQAINAKITVDATDSLNLRFAVGQSRDESDNFINGEFTGNFDTKRDTASLIADFSVSDNNNLLLGVDWYDAQVSSDTDFAETSRDNTGLFSSYSGQVNNTQYDVSLRYDDNEQFGSKTTGGFAVGQKINDTLRIKGSYGTAFKAPSFNQLYFPFDFGNPDLLPEQSKNYELSLDGKFKNTNWEINIFQNDIENLIATTADFSTSENTEEARIRGLEASISTKLVGLNLSTNLTIQDPENLSGANAGKILRNRPERILNIDVDRKFGRFNIGSTLHAESERFTNPDNSAKLGGFTTLDLRADYAVSKNWKVGLKIGNVLDKEYSTNSGFNQDGVNGLLSVKYAPK